MVSAANNHSMPRLPSGAAIRNMTAEIRTSWSLGERHHRARLAMRQQERLLQEILCDGAMQKAS